MGKNEVMPKRYLIIGIITMSTLLFMSVFSIGTIYFGMCAVKETSEQVSELEAQLNQVNEQIVQIETEKQTIKRLEQKTAFLTFDDGPSPKTLAILEILQKYQVQATFYVTGHMVEKYPEIMQQLVDSGQKIAAHSYSHRYSEIYESLATFQADFIKNNEVIKQYTGKDVTLFRHPGGSSATAGAPGVVQTTLYWLDDMGVNYTDWNVDSMDASSQEVASQFIGEETLFQTANQNEYAVILLHDTNMKQATVEALPTIIEGLFEQGYVLDVIPEQIPLAQHRSVK